MAQAVSRSRVAAPKRASREREKAPARTGLWVGAAVAASLLAVGAGAWLSRSTAEPPTGQILAAQIEAAARGRNPERHVFGGALP
jgi:hypothetical protein